jgi:predicted PurR-regulated permease PerM
MPIKNHQIANIQKYFMFGALLLLISLLLIFISPFLTDLLIAAIIVTAVYPVHKLLNKKIHVPRSLSAFISLLLVAIVILLPFALFVFFIAGQAAGAYMTISDKINTLIANNDMTSLPKIMHLLPFSGKIEQFLASTPISTSVILKTAGDMVGNISSFLLGQTTSILKHLSAILVHTIVFLITMFYMLRDGDRLVDYVYSLIPLSKDQKEELFDKLHGLSYGIIYGIFGAAIIQGFLVGIGFSIAGISNAAFWGAIAALFSPLPYIGTAIIWVPAVIAVGAGGHWITALLLAIWCMAIVSTADNFIKPFLIGSKAALHPLAILIVLIGGAFAFGIKGLLFGPFVLTLALSFLHIYRMEYEEILGDSDMWKPQKIKRELPK